MSSKVRQQMRAEGQRGEELTRDMVYIPIRDVGAYFGESVRPFRLKVPTHFGPKCPVVSEQRGPTPGLR